MNSTRNEWLVQQIEQIKKDNPERVIGIVALLSEIKDGSLDNLLPEGLSQCHDFIQDLKMSQSFWFYNKIANLKTS